VPEHQRQVQGDEAEHDGGDEEDVEGEEPAERGSANGITRQDESADLFADERRPRRLRRADDD
jgi:hypothetical protein